MKGINFIELTCQRCGGQLKTISSNTYQCASCGKAFEKQVVTDVADQLRAVLNEQKQEAVANLRRQLWAAMHEQYINSEKIISLARDLKKYLPEDYFANFCEIANGGTDKQIGEFLYKTPQNTIDDYADIVLEFMIKSVTAANLNAISLFIDRAFKNDLESKDKYATWFEQEAEKVNSGIYELNITRDVFLAYSSEDIEKALNLCEFLEANKISCFLAFRNLRHGRGAVDNYDRALQKAIDNCKTVVFVSSANSRSLSCEALKKELPYIRQKDIDGAPAEYKHAYDKLPEKYMMPRVEYLIEAYKGKNAADDFVREFFHGLEWCKSKEAVARRVTKYLTRIPKTDTQSVVVKTVVEEDPDAKYCKYCRTANEQNAKFCSNCGRGEFFASFDEYLASKIKFCALCGKQNNVEAKFCIECRSKEFVSTKKEYDDLMAKIAEEERQKKILEEQERLRKEEAERKRIEEERKLKEDQERLQRVREEQERLRKEREEQERLRRERERNQTEQWRWVQPVKKSSGFKVVSIIYLLLAMLSMFLFFTGFIPMWAVLIINVVEVIIFLIMMRSHAYEVRYNKAVIIIFVLITIGFFVVAGIRVESLYDVFSELKALIASGNTTEDYYNDLKLEMLISFIFALFVNFLAGALVLAEAAHSGDNFLFGIIPLVTIGSLVMFVVIFNALINGTFALPTSRSQVYEADSVFQDIFGSILLSIPGFIYLLVIRIISLKISDI